MGLYKHMRDLWKKPKAELKENYQQKLIEWRQEPVTIRIKRPTRLDRARSLGYRAKEGIIVIRQRVSRGGRQREKFSSGRRPKHMRRKKIVAKNYQQIAEEKASKKFLNCEVINSYKVGEDGLSYWFEVIMADRNNPSIMKDNILGWVAFSTGKAQRGLTSAGRKSRGLRNKGVGAERIRPSLRAQGRRH